MTLMEIHGMQNGKPFVLNRRGRKRKSGKRSKCGKLYVTEVELIRRAREVVLAQPHRRSLPEALQLDQRAESPLGMLNLTGHISEAEYLAGKRWDLVVKRYRSVISAPDPTMQPVAGLGYDIPAEEAAKRKETYDRAYEAMHEAGQKAQHAVSRVAVYGEPCPGGRIPDLRRGLAALARHFGLTNQR